MGGGADTRTRVTQVVSRSVEQQVNGVPFGGTEREGSEAWRPLSAHNIRSLKTLLRHRGAAGARLAEGL